MSLNNLRTLNGEIQVREARIRVLSDELHAIGKAIDDHTEKTRDDMEDLFGQHAILFQERRELYDEVTELAADRDALIQSIHEHGDEPDGFLPAELPTHFDTTPPDDFFKREPGDDEPEWWQAV